MTFKTYEITTDLINPSSASTIRFSQNDQNSAKLLINITNKAVELDLSLAKSVRISFKKPDGTRVFQDDCQPINALKGKYQVILKTQTLTAIGNVIGQVQIEEDNRIIETQKFLFVVDESLMGDGVIESSNEFSIIQKAIDAGEKLEGVDIPALVASKETAEAALAKSTENTNQIGNLSGSQVMGVAGKRFKLIGGAIRNDGTGWKMIDDPTHKNINLVDVYIDPTDENRLRLDHSFTASTIGTLLLAPDETFSKMGLVGGNSGGKGYNLLEFAAPLSIQTAGSTTIESGHKYHMPTTTITKLSDNSGFTLTHGATSTPSPPMVTLADGGSNIGLGGEVRSEFTLTTVTVRYYQYLHGYVKYNGTTGLFEMSTDNVDKATIAWDAVNTALQITHPDINEEFLISVTGAGDLQPYIYTQLVGKMLVRFKDNTGAVVTTPNANMKCNFIRFSKVKSNFPSGLRCNVWRGLAKVKPASISEPFGNFWIIGLNGE